jgi:predicted nucleic acid-binding protein
MLVVDASVAVKWFIQEPETADARALLGGTDPLIAPDLVVPEVINVVWRRLIRGDLERDQVADVPGALPKLFAEFWPSVWLARDAFEIALELRHPVYDCFYLALAESEDAVMVTADRRLLGSLGGTRWEKRCRALLG